MNLMSLMPTIKRARNYYLYDDKGNRFVDLFLDNGRALSGHRPSGLSLAIKNTISRGLYAPYPSIYEDRLKKMLLKDFPSFKYIGLYSSYSDALNLMKNGLILSDPLFDKKSGEFCLWRPFLPISDNTKHLLLKFTFPGIEVVAILSKIKDFLPPSDLISPFILAGFIRSHLELKSKIQNKNEGSWSLLDETSQWNRVGPYLRPNCTKDEYENLFKFYLNSSIIISPEYHMPSICAVGLIEGDLRKLYRNLKGK